MSRIYYPTSTVPAERFRDLRRLFSLLDPEEVVSMHVPVRASKGPDRVGGFRVVSSGSTPEEITEDASTPTQALTYHEFYKILTSSTPDPIDYVFAPTDFLVWVRKHPLDVAEYIPDYPVMVKGHLPVYPRKVGTVATLYLCSGDRVQYNVVPARMVPYPNPTHQTFVGGRMVDAVSNAMSIVESGGGTTGKIYMSDYSTAMYVKYLWSTPIEYVRGMQPYHAVVVPDQVLPESEIVLARWR